MKEKENEQPIVSDEVIKFDAEVYAGSNHFKNHYPVEFDKSKNGFITGTTRVRNHYESALAEKQRELEELRVFLKECIKDEQINISDMRNEKMDMNSAGAGMCMGSLDAYRAILSFINDSFIINPTVAPPTKKGANNEF